MKDKVKISMFTVASILVWGVTMFWCAISLQNTNESAHIQYILGIAATVHLIFIWGPLVFQPKKKEQSDPHR